MDNNSEKIIDLVDIAKKIWAKRKMILMWVAMGAVVGFIIGISRPNQYIAKAVIVPEEANNNASSMGALAGFMGVSMQSGRDGLTSKLYPKIVASTPFLLEFADIRVKLETGDSILFRDYILKEEKHAWWSYIFAAPSQLIGWLKSFGTENAKDVLFEKSQGLQETFAEKLSRLLKVEPNGDDGTIAIIARMQDPQVAAIIADSMYVKLDRYMNIYKTRKTRVNLETNEAKLNQAKEIYYQLDSAYASTFDRNQNLISEQAKIKIARLRDEKSLAFNVYQELAKQVEMDKIKLLEETPIATIIEPVAVPLGKSAPNVTISIILFAFIGGLCSVGKVIFKELK